MTNMANCRMKIDNSTKSQTVITSRIVIIWVRQPSPRSRMSILQKCMDSARTMPTNTRMTLTKTARPCATEESDTVVRPLSLATVLAPCSAPSPSPSESNDPKAENVPNVLFATNIERSIHRGAGGERARRTDETKNEAQRDGRSSD